MNPRPQPPDTPTVPPRRLLPWLVVLIVVAVGVAFAFLYGPETTPLIDATP